MRAFMISLYLFKLLFDFIHPQHEREREYFEIYLAVEIVFINMITKPAVSRI